MPALLSFSYVTLAFQLLMSHNLKNPPSSPARIQTSLGCITAQFTGLFCFSARMGCCPFFLRSNILRKPSSQAVQTIWSCFLKPTAVTLPLKSQNDRSTVFGLVRSQILQVLHMPAISLSFVSETYILFGIKLYCDNFIYQLGQFDPELGSQNFIVPSYDPLANFNSIDLYNNYNNITFISDSLILNINTVFRMSKKLKQKHIEDFLQDIEDFKFGEKQKINLEQHMTPPDIAAKLLFHIYNNEPIEQYTVADIGTGTGMLMCGAIYLQASYVIGFQLDQDYIQTTQAMLDDKVEGADFDLILADIRNFKLRPALMSRPIDLVIMNPPFGTKQAGIDMVFLQFAMNICEGNIYSMHKSSTRKFITKFCQQRLYQIQVIMQVKFPLKKRFNRYHKKQVAFTQVDIIVVRPTKQLLQRRKILAIEKGKIKQQICSSQDINGEQKQKVQQNSGNAESKQIGAIQQIDIIKNEQ